MKWTVIQRGKKFTAIVELGKDPLTGKRKQKWLSGFNDENEANIGAVEFIKKYKAGLLADSQNASFDDLLKYWLENKVEPALSHGTYSSYKIMIEKYISPALGKIKLSKLKTEDIQRLINAMNKQGLSHRYMDYCRVIINAALNFAKERRFIEHNPCKNVIVPRITGIKKQIRTYTAEQVEELLKYTKGKKIYLPILLAVTCGLRRGEIIALRWPDVNFANNTIRITKSIVRAPDGEIIEKDPKSSSSIRAIAVPQMTMDELKTEKERQEKNKKDLGDEYQDQGYVVCWDNGEPFKPDYISKAFKSAIRALKLPDITFHDLRHTHATLLLEQKVHPKIVQERLGHSTISMTLDIYSHVLPNLQQEAANKMDDIFD